MKWMICIIKILFPLSLAILGIWKINVSEKFEIAKKLGIGIAVLICLGAIVGIIYNTYKEPTREQVEADKKQDAELFAYTYLRKLEEKCPQFFGSQERESEFKEYLIQIRNKIQNDDPAKILSFLINEENSFDTKAKENTDKLVEINKEIAIFAQSQGELTTALNAANKILEYSPQNSFAFRERGSINHRLGKIDDAEQDYLKSIELSRTGIEKASSLISIGVFYSWTGKLEKAAECYESAYKLGEKLNNSAIKASSDMNLSNVYDSLGKTQEAEILINRAIIEFEKSGDAKSLIGARINQAVYYLGHGKIHEAKQRLGDLEKSAESEKDDFIKSVIYTNLSNFYSTLNDLYLAEIYAIKAIEIYERLKLEGGMATNYGNLGVIYRRQGKLLKAEEEQNKSLILFRKLNDGQGVCRGLMNLGIIKEQQKEYEEARKYFDEGLSIAKQIDNKRYIADGYGNLCGLHMEQRNFKDAKLYIEKALSIYDDIDGKYEKACALYNLASIYKETGDKELAIEKWIESKKIFERLGLPHMVKNVNAELGKLTTESIKSLS